MALDVYVMPLWRFKAGIFTSPIEEVLGIKPTVISLADSPRPQAQPPWYLRLLASLGIIEFEVAVPEAEESPAEAYHRANREVDALKTEMTRLTELPVDWQDVGEKVYGDQFHGHDFIKAFAAWCDHRDALPEFADPPEANYYKHAVWEQPKPVQRRFPTLVEHSLHTGYFLPVAFEGVHQVEPFKIADHWEFHHAVASTQTILRELNDLLALIAEMPVTPVKPGHLRTIETAAHDCTEQLRKICELSLAHDLPVIFYG